MSAAGPAEGRFPCFEGLRAIAALMVIVYHCVFFTTFFDTPGGTLLWNLNVGVWVFFVTSGFLLYLPFAGTHLRPGGRVDWRAYAVRRVARIYPAYWAVLAFFTFVVPRAQIFGVNGFVRNVTLTQMYTKAPNPFLEGLPPAWSLSVEITFYAFLPLYAAAIGVLAAKRRAFSVEIAGIALLGAVGLGAIVAVAFGRDPAWVTVLPQHAAAFALGMLLAVLSSHQWSASATSRLEQIGRASWIWWTLALGAFVTIPLILRIEPFERMNAAQNIGLNVCQTLIGLFVVVPAVLGPQDHGRIRGFLRSRVLTFLGLISYGLYLWHWFVLSVVQGDWLGWNVRQGNWITLLVLGLPVVIAAATASWYLLERPVIRLARTVGRRGPTRPTTEGRPHRPALHDA